MDRASALKAKPFLLAWCLCFLVMESAGVLVLRSRPPLDFQSFYTAGYQLRTHPTQLYDLSEQALLQHKLTSQSQFLPYYHPCYEAILYLPLSFLSFHGAYLAFVAVSMFSLLGAFLIARPTLPSAIFLRLPRADLVVFVFVPLLIAVTDGQDSLISLLLYCLAWRQLESGKDASAGCMLALALFKFHIVIPIAILIVIWRGRRFCYGFLATFAGVALLCICLVGAGGSIQYFRLLSGAVSAIDRGSIRQHGMAVHPSAMVNLAGILYGGGARLLHSPIAFNLLVGACSLGLLFWCILRVRRCEQRVAFSISILFGLLVSYHLMNYDLTLALLPAVLLVDRMHRAILLAFFIVPALFFFLGQDWYFLMAVPMLAMLLYALINAPQPVAPTPEMPSATAV